MSETRRQYLYELLGLLAAADLALLGYLVVAQPEGYWTAVAAGIQGLATIALVWVTTRYAGLVEEQAEAAQDSAEAAADSAEATRRLAELEARVARQEMVADLETLHESLDRTRDVVRTWISNNPPWQEIKNGRSEPRPLGRGDWEERHQIARKAIAGLRISDERRKYLNDTVHQANEVRKAIGEIRRVQRVEDRNPVEEANAASTDVEGLKKRLDETLREVESLRDEFVARPQ